MYVARIKKKIEEARSPRLETLVGHMTANDSFGDFTSIKLKLGYQKKKSITGKITKILESLLSSLHRHNRRK